MKGIATDSAKENASSAIRMSQCVVCVLDIAQQCNVLARKSKITAQVRRIEEYYITKKKLGARLS